MLASTRGVRQEVRDVCEEFRAGNRGLCKEIAGLRADLKAGDDAFREEVKTSFGDFNTWVSTVEHRIAKVEGIIEELFWGSRNQPSDRPREAAA